MTVTEASPYLGMFGTAFGAATLLPMQSELVLATLLLTGDYPVAALWGVATLGNVLGSCVNWSIGLRLERFHDRRWFPIKPATLEKAMPWYHRFGRWSLLLSWLPVVGDALTVIAGLMREPWWSFLLIVTLAKAGRYLAIIYATSPWM